MDKSDFQSAVQMILILFIALSMPSPSSGAAPVKTPTEGATEKIQVPGSHSDHIPVSSDQDPAINPGPGTVEMNLAEQFSERNRKACVEWCDANQECEMCRGAGLCGIGYKVLRTWEGPGMDWDACKFVSRAPTVHPRPPEGSPEIPGQRKTPLPLAPK